MPAVSEKQKRFMDAVAHNPAFAKQAGVPQSVGQDFSEASKGLKFGKGSGDRADLQRVNKPETKHGKMALMKKGGKTMANTSRMNRLEELGRVDAEKASTKKGKHNLSAEKKRVVKELKYAKGGMTTGRHGVAEKSGITTAKMGRAEVGGKLKHGEHSIQKRGHTKAMHPTMSAGGKNKPLGMKHGGHAKK